MGALEDAVCTAKGKLHELADRLTVANAEAVVLELVDAVKGLHAAAVPPRTPSGSDSVTPLVGPIEEQGGDIHPP